MEENEKALRQAKVEKINLYSSVFINDDGQKVILDLMDNGHILKPTTGPTDRESAINEGKREMVLYILDMISYNAEDIVTLIGNKERDKPQGDRNEKNEVDFDFFND